MSGQVQKSTKSGQANVEFLDDDEDEGLYDDDV
jgi:hypothetical protein